jgi:hypothetical protein
MTFCVEFNPYMGQGGGERTCGSVNSSSQLTLRVFITNDRLESHKNLSMTHMYWRSSL